MATTVFSADSHVIEPPEMWAERIDPKYRDQAPRLEYDIDGKKGGYFVCEGIKPIPIAKFFATGLTTDLEKWKEWTEGGMKFAPKSVYDPAERLKEQDIDHVDGELLYPTMGMMLFRIANDELKAASLAAMNSWLAEYCAHSPDRLVGVGAVSLHDVPAAIRELERTRKLGLKGMMVTGNPPKGEDFSARLYDPFWAAVQDLDIKITMHDLVSRDKAAFVNNLGVMGFFLLPMEVQATLAGLILGGVFDRFPKLKFISAENDISWFPHFMYRLDHGWEQLGKRYVAEGTQWDLELKPSDYVKRNLWATFQFEGKANLEYVAEIMGADRVMWGSDYPHPDSTWPHSQEHLSDALSTLAPDDREKIVGGNVMNLYDIKLPPKEARLETAIAANF
ncbi:MAG: amidohydrolase family protein [Methyloceanibacter sp.]